jgi:hypothetical protein
MRRVDGRVHLTAKDWSRLSASAFENLCADMLRALGFHNVQLLAGPGDKGRDILWERAIEVAPGISARLSWIIQCKHTVNGLAKHELYKELVKAREHRIDFWWLLTSARLTPAVFDWIHGVERSEFPFRISCLDRETLTSAVLELPRILGKYFSFTLGPPERVWVDVMDVMSEGRYEDALALLRASDKKAHPRTSYLIACCLSMLAQRSGSSSLVEEAFQSLEEANRRGYIGYMRDLVGWPEAKCRSHARSDPELSWLMKLDAERFLRLFGPPASEGSGIDFCLDSTTLVAVENGVDVPIHTLIPGSRIVTSAAREPVLGELAAVKHFSASDTIRINSEVRSTPRHRFHLATC